MSDNWLILIPRDPRFLPNSSQVTAAESLVRSTFSNADIVFSEAHDYVDFYDCGGNFENVCCPHCGVQIDEDWWKDWVDEDFRTGFAFTPRPMHCCSASSGINDLVYNWDQGFAKFAISVGSPGVGDLEDAFRQELEGILRCSLRVIWRHV